MKKLIYLIVLALILSLVLTGCSLLSNISQVPSTEQSGITCLTKNPSSDLVGLWHLDEGTGTTAYDSSGNPNDGTLMGDTSWISGKFANALSFDGHGDYVQLPASNTILNTNIFTIEAWFKTSVNHPVYGVGAMEGRIVNLARDAAGFSAVALYVEENNIAVCYRTVTEFKHLKHAVNYYDDVWHHIAVTCDATTYRLYYDGSLVASQTDTFYGFGTSAAYLGTFNSSERFFNGLIDEVRIWNVALLPNQLAFYGFNGLLAPYVAPPKAFKIGRSIPLKWQYTDLFGVVVDSSAADPYVEIKPVSNGDTPVEGDPIVVEDPGSSGYQYDWETDTWQFNWQTKGCEAGIYAISIKSNQTGQTDGPFLIQLR